jgi:transcriptional regulator with XRE-family HTH domain
VQPLTDGAGTSSRPAPASLAISPLAVPGIPSAIRPAQRLAEPSAVHRLGTESDAVRRLVAVLERIVGPDPSGEVSLRALGRALAGPTGGRFDETDRAERELLARVLHVFRPRLRQFRWEVRDVPTSPPPGARIVAWRCPSRAASEAPGWRLVASRAELALWAPPRPTAGRRGRAGGGRRAVIRPTGAARRLDNGRADPGSRARGGTAVAAGDHRNRVVPGACRAAAVVGGMSGLDRRAIADDVAEQATIHGMDDPADRSRARQRRPELGEVPPGERVRLAARFGTLLRMERGYRTQLELADLAGLNVSTIKRLEGGYRRPTAASVWAIARALRGDLRARVALDERLRQSAEASFRDYGRRPDAAREQMRLQLRLEADGGVPPADSDELGGAIVAELARAFGREPATQPDRNR